jgi:polysaccharide export outer membrane protein
LGFERSIASLAAGFVLTGAFGRFFGIGPDCREANMRILLALVLWLGCWSAAIAQSGLLQPGDVISISVYQDPKLDRQLLIGPTGMIAFPLVGQIKAAGMTPSALESVLKARLKGKFSEEPDVTVSLTAEKALEEDLKPRVYITGEVLRPGFFVVRTKLDVMQAIAMAGGFSPFAAKRRIQVRRKVDGVESVFVFNYDDFFSGANLNDNVRVRAGDVIIVPERGLLE